jgi:Transcription factor WhiB
MVEPACLGTDPEAWFSTRRNVVVACVRICAGCPLRQACLAGALDRDEQFGVWGGVVFSRRWTSAWPDPCNGHWSVRGTDIFGLVMRRGVFASREDARRHADVLLAISRQRRDRALRAQARPAGSTTLGRAA